MNKTATIKLLTAVATGITNGMSKRADSAPKPPMFQSSVTPLKYHTKGNTPEFRPSMFQSSVPPWKDHTKDNNPGFKNRLMGAVGTATRSNPIINGLIGLPGRIGYSVGDYIGSKLYKPDTTGVTDQDIQNYQYPEGMFDTRVQEATARMRARNTLSKLRGSGKPTQGGFLDDVRNLLRRSL